MIYRALTELIVAAKTGGLEMFDTLHAAGADESNGAEIIVG